MSMSDPLADMFTRIKNGQAAGKLRIAVPFSNLKIAVNKVLKQEGYICGFDVTSLNGKSIINIDLKYYNGLPVINNLARVSKPGRRVYCKKDKIPNVLGGLGVSIITSSEGILTDVVARKKGLGGEVLCRVS